MGYYHVQSGRWHWLLWMAAAGCVVLAWTLRDQPVLLVVPLGTAVILAVCAPSFQYLEVSDQGDHLLVRFGPLPIGRKRIRYDEITAAEIGRTHWIDGWGVHWVPLRGWTYNIWGFDCVKLRLGQRVIRIGTDDPGGLLQFLRTRIKVENNAGHA